MNQYEVNLLPQNQTVQVGEGETLLEALRRESIYVKSSCGGVASCSDCIIKVVGGESNLTPPTFAELKLLGNVFHITKERLSCQTKVTGNCQLDLSRHDEKNDQDKRVQKSHNLQSSKSKLRKASSSSGARREYSTGGGYGGSKPAGYQEAPKLKNSGQKRPKPFKTDT